MATTIGRARPETGPDQGGPTVGRRQRTLVLASMCLALVLVIAGVSMLAVALPSVGDDLGLSQTSLTWVADAYALTLASLLLLAGALGDRYGRRSALLVGIAIFGGGSLLSALATSGIQLIAFRALTGIGGALIMPGTLSTITSVFPAGERPRAVGIWAGFAGAGGTLGMLAAGWMLGSFAWESIFFATAAVSAITFLVVLAFVPATRSQTHVGLDPLGTVLSAFGIGAIVLGIIEGPIRGWTAPLTLAALITGAVLAVAFIRWELRAEHPLLDPRLFGYRGFAVGSASLLVLFVALFGLFLIILEYLQLMLGYSALKAAVALLPLTFLMIPISASAAPLSVRYGMKLVSGTGLLVTGAGMVAFGSLDAHSSFGALLVAQLLLGVGIGLAMTPATNAIVSSLPAAKQGVASAVNDTTREIGTALGIAFMGSMFNTGYRRAIEGDVANLPSGVAHQVQESPGIALGIAGQLPGRAGDALAEATRTAFASGMRLSMLIGAALLAGAALFVWLRGPDREQEADVTDELDAVYVDEGDGDLEPAVA